MLPDPLLRQIRRLTLQTRKAARELLAGHYESAVRGAGLTFAEVRTYQPGDDIRHIDWNVTARTGVPHVKRFIEERERVVYLVVDVSASQQVKLGPTKSKRETVAEVAALLTFAAAALRDRVGLLHFTDTVEQWLRPAKGDRHARRIARELFVFQPRRTQTDIATALAPLRRRRRSVVFLLSDFQAKGWDRAVKVIAKRHELIAVVVGDPAEHELPRIGRVRLTDAEGHEVVVINTHDAKVRAQYRQAASERRDAVNQRLRSAGAEVVEVSTAGGHLESLVRFFRTRERRR